MQLIKQRNFLFDNLKALLIFLVVLGHILEIFCKNSVFLLFYNIIYSFHMPAFVFIAGYFSKNIDNIDNSLIFDFLFPYAIFNSFYQLIFYKTLNINLLSPAYIYWFLLSMFFWKVILKSLIKVRFIFFLSFIFSLYCGFFDEVSRFLSVSRTVVFLPYFLIGYFCTEEIINKIKRTSKSLGFILFLITLCITFFLFKYNVIPLEISKGADSYNVLDLSVFTGIYSRLSLFIIATSFIVSIINLTSVKQFRITYIGERTLVIYLFHPFFIPLVKKMSTIVLSVNSYFGIIICLILAILITLLLSVSLLEKCYKSFFNFIFKFFKRNNPVKITT